jgi:hypothetical protein
MVISDFLRGPKFWQYRFKWWLVDKFDITLKAPLHVDIELTNQCNLACTMCPHGSDDWNPVKGMMRKETAKSIIDQCVKNGVYSIKLQFRGESSLHKDLVEIVQYAKRKGILEVQMNTNGIPYTGRKIEDLVLAGLDRLIVSIDGATPETYKKIRIGGELVRVERTLRLFSWMKYIHHSKTPYIRIQMTQQDANDKEAEVFKKQWSKYGEVIVKQVRSRNTGDRKRCSQPFQRMVYAWNGRIYGCCNAWNEESLITKQGIMFSMKAIWGMMDQLREKARHPELGEPCKTCQIRSSYK